MLKGLTHAGQLIDAGQPGAAYVVDPDEPGTDTFIESVRTRYAKENPDVGVAHVAINGVSVPVSVNDIETPQQKFVRLEGEGVLSREPVVATTQGIKTQSESGLSGLGVDDAPRGGVVAAAGTHVVRADESPATEPPARAPDETAMIDALGEPVAQKLFDAGITSRALLAAKNKSELDAIPGIGPASIEKIEAFLAAISGE